LRTRRADFLSASFHARKSKNFFSEEKKQKTFMSLSRFSPAARTTNNKSFLVLFFKKELLALPSFKFIPRNASLTFDR
jgi:hypothetical protein